jgi:hypothetical protein
MYFSSLPSFHVIIAYTCASVACLVFMLLLPKMYFSDMPSFHVIIAYTCTSVAYLVFMLLLPIPVLQ